MKKAVWGSAAALALLSACVAAGWLSGADHEGMAWVAMMRAPSVDGLMRVVTWFGSAPWTAVALLGISAWSVRHQGGRAALARLGAFLIGVVLTVALRLLVPHWRPDAATVPAAMSWLARVHLSSFPSGHAYRSAFVFGWLARQWHGVHHHWGRRAAFFSYVLIGLVGISRVYLNRHWPSDVLGGWLVALLVFALAHREEPTAS